LFNSRHQPAGIYRRLGRRAIRDQRGRHRLPAG
jgi:hypothetical protein